MDDSDSMASSDSEQDSLFSDSESFSDEECSPQQCRMRIGTWNINGLADYKQLALLVWMGEMELDVLAVCETHLVNSEQLVQWQRCIDQHRAYQWFGRAAVCPNGEESKRGSGGVGLLVKKEWADYVTAMPPCEHSSLHFIRLDLPDSPFSMFIGVVYMACAGGHRFEENGQLMDELEERILAYQGQGVVCVMGDFNIHISSLPSTIHIGEPIDSLFSSSHVSPFNTGTRILKRQSCDVTGVQRETEATNSGIELIDRLDSVGMVVCNGLCEIGDGRIARATCRKGASDSVIDYILIDSEHWECMDSVAVEEMAYLTVTSDHNPVISAINYQPNTHNQSNKQPLSSSLFRLPPASPLNDSILRRRVTRNSTKNSKPGALSLWEHWQTVGSRHDRVANQWKSSLHGNSFEIPCIQQPQQPSASNSFIPPNLPSFQLFPSLSGEKEIDWLSKWRRERRQIHEARLGVRTQF